MVVHVYYVFVLISAYDIAGMKPLGAPRRDSVVRSHSEMRFDDVLSNGKQEVNSDQEEEVDDFELFCKQAGRRLSSCADWGGSLPDIPKESNPNYSLAKALLTRRLHAPLRSTSSAPVKSRNSSGNSGSEAGSPKAHRKSKKLANSFKGILDDCDGCCSNGRSHKGYHSVPHSRSGSVRKSRKQRHDHQAESGSQGGSRPDSLVFPYEVPDDHYLLRQFETTAKGGVVNRGDSIRSCSTPSIKSIGSSNGSDVIGRSESHDLESSPSGNKEPSPLAANTQHGHQVYKVLLVGARGVGKTTLVKQFRSSDCATDADPVFEGKINELLKDYAHSFRIS